MYTENHKIRDTLFLTITLAKLKPIFIVLYHFNQEEILHATAINLSHHVIYVRTLPGKIKTYIFAVVHTRGSVHLTATLSNLNRFQ